MAIYVTSDLHINHAREFIYKPRGFDTVELMNITIFTNYQNLITDDDDVYILGDLMLGPNDEDGMKLLRQLHGKIHIIRGNHDTDRRIELYKTLPQVVEICDAKYLHYKKHHIYLSHFPTLTGNLQNEALTQMTMNFYGHTHQKTNFFEDRPYMYHVGVDSHNCTPVLIDDALAECHAKVKECIEQL